jgi:probable phosphoglycerate mutase
MSFGEVAKQWPEDLAAWMGSAEAAPPGGESFAAVAKRVLSALDRLFSAHAGQTIVVVSHVTPIKTLVCHALGAPSAALFRMHLDVASLCEVDWFADGPALVRSLNDTSYLRSN